MVCGYPYSKSGWINLKFLMSGYYFTLLLSFTSILISIAVGLLIALPGLSKIRGLGILTASVEIVRSVPILVLILGLLWPAPNDGLEINVFWAGVIALALSDSAFQAEIFPREYNLSMRPI